MREANSALKKVHCVQQRKQRMCDIKPATISHSYPNQVIHNCAGNQCSGVPFLTGFQTLYFFKLVFIFYLCIQHNVCRINCKKVQRRIHYCTLSALTPQLWYLPADLISSPPKPLQSRKRAFREQLTTSNLNSLPSKEKTSKPFQNESRSQNTCSFVFDQL